MNWLLALYGLGAVGIFVYFYLIDDLFDGDYMEMVIGAFLAFFIALFWPVYAGMALLFSPLILLKLGVRALLERL